MSTFARAARAPKARKPKVKKPKATIKPRAVRSPSKNYALGAGAGGWQYTRKPAAAKPPQPVGMPAPAAAPTPALPQAQRAQSPGPPPRLPSSLASITDAEQAYGIAMPDVNRQLFEAAWRYGGSPQVAQYGLGPGGDTTYNRSVGDNPNSLINQILRSQQETAKSTGEVMNQRGTFFSGLHQQALADQSSDADRQRLQGFDDFQTSINDLATAILQARLQRDSTRRGADAADLEAALSDQPVPAPSEESPPESPASGPQFNASDPYGSPVAPGGTLNWSVNGTMPPHIKKLWDYYYFFNSGQMPAGWKFG